MSINIPPENLFLGPRPGKKSMQRLADLKLTHICTLLSAREQGQAIEKISQRLGCRWIWLPIDGGHCDTLSSMDWAAMLAAFGAQLAEVASPRVYVHCSAGIHRTGFFAYLLLRSSGLEPDVAAAALAQCRAVTAQDVGEDRLALAERVLAGEAMTGLAAHRTHD